MTEQKPRGFPYLLLGVLLFVLGFWVGGLYTRQIMETQVAAVHLHDLVLRYHDWERFAAHVRRDQERFGRSRVPFPSNEALTWPKPARFKPHPARSIPSKASASPAALQEALPSPSPSPVLKTTEVSPPLFETRIETIRLDSNDGLEARYSLGVLLTNREPGTEILSPEDVKIEDQNGRSYSAFRAHPDFPDAGIQPNQSFHTILQFLVPYQSVPEKLIVVSSSVELIPPVDPSMYQPCTDCR